MVLTGRESFIARDEAADMAKEATEANVESVQMPVSGHWCAEEAPEAFVQAMLNFAGKHEKTR